MAGSTGPLDIELLIRTTRRTEGGIDVPILRRQKSKLQRRDGQAVSAGISDYQDVFGTCMYNEFHSCPLLYAPHPSLYSSIGPFVPRLVTQGTLTYPMFTITLQWDSVDISGNMGIMLLGKLPSGVNNDSLTWVKARGYTTTESGMTAPLDSPGDLYPIAWEVPIDDVWSDGQVLP